MTGPRYAPMLAVGWDRPFDDEAWMFEPKLDGIRALVHVESDGVVIRSRAGNVMTDAYPELGSLADLAAGTVVDGEIIAYDQHGVPSFQHLQSRTHRTGGSEVAVAMVAFDLLAVEGHPVLDVRLEARLETLAAIDLPSPVTRSTSVVGRGRALFEATAERGLEGVMAKRRDSLYRPGERSPAWRKIPHVHRTRAVVGGFTETDGAGGFGALILGLWDADQLRYVGSVGTGFDRESSAAIRQALDEMAISRSPFHEDPAIPDATFVNPHLVAEIAYKQWTRAARLRAPSFKGFSDVPHESVTWSTEGPAS